MEFEEEKEEGKDRKQEAAERKDAGAASQGLQGRGLSQQKDTEDRLPDESSDERTSSKAHKKKGEDQGGSACKTEPWATGANEAGAVAAGVGVKFGNLSVGGGEAETVTGQRLVAALERVMMCLKAWMQSVLSTCKKAR